MPWRSSSPSDGASLIVSDISPTSAEETAELVRAAGAQAEVVSCDVTDRDAVFALVEETEKRLGGIDFIANNAGVGDRRAIRRDLDRGLALDGRHQSLGRDLRMPGSDSQDARSGARLHPQRRLGRWPSRARRDVRLQRHQGGRRLAERDPLRRVQDPGHSRVRAMPDLLHHEHHELGARGPPRRRKSTSHPLDGQRPKCKHQTSPKRRSIRFGMASSTCSPCATAGWAWRLKRANPQRFYETLARAHVKFLARTQ